MPPEGVQPRLLDLFSGAGGAAYGYMQAGFHLTGVDHVPQPRYPGQHFIQADALDYLAQHGCEYDVIHASPPCQGYSVLKHLVRKAHPMLVEEVRAAVRTTGKPYVIENVVGAPLDATILLCGSMFGLQTPCGAQLRRHRVFESTILLLAPGGCAHGMTAMRGSAPRTISIAGDHPRDRRIRSDSDRQRTRETFSIADARRAMGIDWMGMRDLAQAIPPAYTCWIGRQLRHALDAS